jgi:hypothetical protein
MIQSRMALLALFALALIPGSCNPRVAYERLSDEEKNLFVTVEDLGGFGAVSGKTSADAEVRKQDILGSSPLPCGYLGYEYEFEQETSADADFIYIWCMIQKINRCPAVNLSRYHDLGVNLGLKQSKRELVDLPRFYKYNEQSSSSLVLEDGQPIGNLIRVRDDNFQYLLIVYGIYFEDEDEWNPFFREKIESARSFLMR